MIKKEQHALNAQEQELMLVAREAHNLAYAPYSEFLVGVSIRMEDGELIRGANQENAAYPLCLCAERVALSYAAMHHPGKLIDSMAICTSKIPKNEVAPSPCGACRQVIAEYETRQDKPIKLYLQGHDEVFIFEGIGDLLPHSFSGKNL